LPVTITLRGTEVPHSKNAAKRRRIQLALKRATRVFSVSDSLRQLAIQLGAPAEKLQVVGNGVDVSKFAPMDRREARARLGLSEAAKVIVSVGALVPRKGFHRVIECLPELLKRHPDLHYLVVGGASPEGDMGRELRTQAAELGLVDRVHFLGPMPPAELRLPLSAADVFVLATSNEGWANVFLEAMACGLPVVTTDVGGNAEVVREPALGRVVALGDRPALTQAIDGALSLPWDRARIMDYARQNSWDERVRVLVGAFTSLAGPSVAAQGGEPRPVRSEQ
jgi:glycosyltransferase involved in cell wall biosynthesis